MDQHKSGQLAGSAAEVYEQFFVPALFQDWPKKILDIADLHTGDSILDVACGTGILAREALLLVGEKAKVVGIDVNLGMLNVARNIEPRVQWLQGEAESLPFKSESFDKVVSQFGLMFFNDQVKAIREMRRIVQKGGNVVIAVWASLDETPGYAEVAHILEELFGRDVAQSIEVPYSLGDVDKLRSLLKEADIRDYRITTVKGMARFPSLDSWIYTDIKGWTLADVIDDEGYQAFSEVALERLNAFSLPDGSVEFDTPAHVISFSS